MIESSNWFILVARTTSLYEDPVSVRIGKMPIPE
jgi:hypothetical protein